MPGACHRERAYVFYGQPPRLRGSGKREREVERRQPTDRTIPAVLTTRRDPRSRADMDPDQVGRQLAITLPFPGLRATRIQSRQRTRIGATGEIVAELPRLAGHVAEGDCIMTAWPHASARSSALGTSAVLPRAVAATVQVEQVQAEVQLESRIAVGQ
jgi:hypothetical protein